MINIQLTEDSVWHMAKVILPPQMHCFGCHSAMTACKESIQSLIESIGGKYDWNKIGWWFIAVWKISVGLPLIYLYTLH
jgi:hypothetical protein